MVVAEPQVKAFQLKGSLFTLTILQLTSVDPELLQQQIDEMIQQAPKFFINAPIVIDLQKLAHHNLEYDLTKICSTLRQKQLIPVGFCGCPAHLQPQVLAAGLAILPTNKSQQDLPENTDSQQATTPAQSQPVSGHSRLVTQPVRSGQQIYAKGGDLIILSSVSPGAEVLADGHIHVYGKLSGRAMAGINNNTQARIFCRELDAELISIAGLYQLSEEFSVLTDQQNVQIYLKEQRLCLDNLKI